MGSISCKCNEVLMDEAVNTENLNESNKIFQTTTIMSGHQNTLCKIFIQI